MNLPYGSQSYEYSKYIGPSQDITSQTISQSTSNWFGDFARNDIESTISPSGSSRNSDDGFLFGTHESIQLSSDSIYSIQSYGSLFTWKKQH